MSDLRSRIAAVLARLYDPKCCDECDMRYGFWAVDDYLLDADAVIAELGLKRESMLDGISPVDDPPPWHHRYVTNWVADDEPQQNREFTE